MVPSERQWRGFDSSRCTTGRTACTCPLPAASGDRYSSNRQHSAGTDHRLLYIDHLLIDKIKAVKDNKEEFERLAEDAASIVFAVWRSYEKSEDKKNWPGPHLDDVIIDLLG